MNDQELFVAPIPTPSGQIKRVVYTTRWVPSNELGCRKAFFGKKLIAQRKYYEERKPVWPYSMVDKDWERTGEVKYKDATYNDIIQLGINLDLD